MDLTLIRQKKTDKVTLGTFHETETGYHICCSLEEPWKNNQRKISCIPSGTYVCKPYSSLKFENVWEITNVPGRDKVLIHTGNTTDDIEGCILPGMEHGIFKAKDAVLRSGEAMLKLRVRNAGKSFNLIIKEI